MLWVQKAVWGEGECKAAFLHQILYKEPNFLSSLPLSWTCAELDCWQQVSPLHLLLGGIFSPPLQRGSEEGWETECDLWTLELLKVLKPNWFSCILPDPSNNYLSSSRPHQTTSPLDSASHSPLFSSANLSHSSLHLLSLLHSSLATITSLFPSSLHSEP